MAVMTHYTTQDQAYFYADLHRLPRLSQEEQRALLASTPPTAAHLDRAARNRLVEGHLGLATHIAIRECPPTFKRALNKEKFVRVPHNALSRARANGTEKALYNLQPESLDVWMAWYEMEEAEELPIRPITPTAAAPECDPALRTQVETWLSYLSAQEQTIVRLHYGLSEEDERAYSATEIARLQGVKPGTMQKRLRTALTRLKALAQGSATITQKRGKPRVTNISRYKPPTLTPEQESTLMQTAAALHQQRLAHVAAVFAEHVAQGERITSGKQLARLARTSETTALEFLHAERSKSHATC